MMHVVRLLTLGLLPLVAGCADESSPSSPSATPTTDTALFRRITETNPLGSYTNFPNAEEFTTGRLNGSEAHRPVVRVRLNAVARDALTNGRLASGARFPEGSIVLKEVRQSATSPATLLIVMVKEAANPLAANGWLWAEYGPTGSVAYSVNARGGACTSCHMREQGPQNDLVRTFERQQ